MTNPEFGEPIDTISNAAAVWELKMAQTVIFSSPMKWESEGGNCLNRAQPVLMTPEDESIDLATLGELPLGLFRQVLPVWSVIRLRRPDINGQIQYDRFIIVSDADETTIHISHTIPAEILDQEAPGVAFEKFVTDETKFQQETGFHRGTNEEGRRILASVISSLKIEKDAAFKADIERRLNMTEDERRWERMQKYAYLVTSEMKKNSGPKWWSITEGGILWAVHSNTPDEAVIMIEDSRGGVPMLPFFLVAEYSDDIQVELTEKNGEEKVVRMIPYSNEPWPSDVNHMTPAQEAALKRLRNPD